MAKTTDVKFEGEEVEGDDFVMVIVAVGGPKEDEGGGGSPVIDGGDRRLYDGAGGGIIRVNGLNNTFSETEAAVAAAVEI